MLLLSQSLFQSLYWPLQILLLALVLFQNFRIDVSLFLLSARDVLLEFISKIEFELVVIIYVLQNLVYSRFEILYVNIIFPYAFTSFNDQCLHLFLFGS
jgi:hypothetical protein